MGSRITHCGNYASSLICGFGIRTQNHHTRSHLTHAQGRNDSQNVEGGPHNKIFADAGFAVAYPPPDRDPYHEDTLIDLLKDAQAVVAGSEPFTPRSEERRVGKE